MMQEAGSDRSAQALHREINACTHCAAHLPLGPRPVVQFASTSRVLIIGQAPGTKVHRSGVPWNDDSGDRLREWLDLEKGTFYDPAAIALMPIGFCYPGKASGGDAPPRPECAPLWHQRILDTLPKDRLTLLVGAYAQSQYLPEKKRWSMTDRVKRADECAPFICLPHPSWRAGMWMAKNPWFHTETLPRLRQAVSFALQE